MIENVTKSVKRKETIDAAYMEKLFDDMISLYRLDQLGMGGTAAGASEFGPLPTTSVMLLSALAVTWVLIFAYVVWQAIKRKKEKQNADKR